jgi:hypothetical protein
VAGELLFQHVGQPAGAAGELLGELRIEHAGEGVRAGARAVLGLGRGVAHALEHLLHEQRLELHRGCAAGSPGIGGSLLAQRVERTRVT